MLIYLLKKSLQDDNDNFNYKSKVSSETSVDNTDLYDNIFGHDLETIPKLSSN